jgi:hypothetical protein
MTYYVGGDGRSVGAGLIKPLQTRGLRQKTGAAGQALYEKRGRTETAAGAVIGKIIILQIRCTQYTYVNPC